MCDWIVLADINNLNDVLSTKLERFPKHRWMEFGLRCGLHHDTLKIIQADNPKDTEGCFTECVACWLKRKDDVDKKGKPTLQRLADIVGNIGDKATAENIRSQIKKKRKKKNKGTHTHPVLELSIYRSIWCILLKNRSHTFDCTHYQTTPSIVEIFTIFNHCMH